MFSCLLMCRCYTFRRNDTVRGGERALCDFLLSIPFPSSLFCARELASLETHFRLVQAACPRGAGRDEGPAFLPVLITKRQGALQQINGKGLGTNAGHVW